MTSAWLEVQAQAERLAIEVLRPARSAAIAARFAEAFVADAEARWWWDALRADVTTASVAYGDRDPWPLLREWLPEERPLILLVTDDESTPAGGVQARPGKLAQLVAECPYFEYLVTDDKASFGVFDTHHNQLIRVGSVPG